MKENHLKKNACRFSGSLAWEINNIKFIMQSYENEYLSINVETIMKHMLKFKHKGGML